MRAGRLRHRVCIERRTQTQDTYGQPEDTWTRFAERWASVGPLSGQERLDAQQVRAGLSHVVRIRHCEGVKPAMRVVFKGRIFDIDSVIDRNERGIEMELQCREQV